ncbi:uncharacterized protein PgNI_07191 [Pyricularia grisea]|uniref:Uncharacterized protein n=1 Tax=Pyricularia grisea TaxID=148305 RepID=A0A6P8B0S2_PYRGI|nr:uncharacterized protein PgNI_07191 [Pyricularia grisea]TLD08457.1 hypothetical protein PgNI_07191 [Pyricularia grisea]
MRCQNLYAVITATLAFAPTVFAVHGYSGTSPGWDCKYSVFENKEYDPSQGDITEGNYEYIAGGSIKKNEARSFKGKRKFNTRNGTPKTRQ